MAVSSLSASLVGFPFIVLAPVMEASFSFDPLRTPLSLLLLNPGEWNVGSVWMPDNGDVPSSSSLIPPLPPRPASISFSRIGSDDVVHVLDRRMFLRNGFQESEYHASLRAARLIESIEAIVSKRIDAAQEPKGMLARYAQGEN